MIQFIRRVLTCMSSSIYCAQTSIRQSSRRSAHPALGPSASTLELPDAIAYYRPIWIRCRRDALLSDKMAAAKWIRWIRAACCLRSEGAMGRPMMGNEAAEACLCGERMWSGRPYGDVLVVVLGNKNKVTGIRIIQLPNTSTSRRTDCPSILLHSLKAPSQRPQCNRIIHPIDRTQHRRVNPQRQLNPGPSLPRLL